MGFPVETKIRAGRSLSTFLLLKFSCSAGLNTVLLNQGCGQSPGGEQTSCHLYEATLLYEATSLMPASAFRGNFLCLSVDLWFPRGSEMDPIMY